jgi:hypothetical protein
MNMQTITAVIDFRKIENELHIGIEPLPQVRRYSQLSFSFCMLLAVAIEVSHGATRAVMA